MRDIIMNRWSTYCPFFVQVSDKKVVDIIITKHAQTRWIERVTDEKCEVKDICDFLWLKLKSKKFEPYYTTEEEVYVIDDDLLVVVKFSVIENEVDLIGGPLHRMTVLTFLGKMSQSLELRDIKSYYSWLRHSRRMGLIKNSRKKR
ncbi:hypothetical protein B5M42_021415 [Paenibacillus athensensis]|uniref:Periplasmic protein n=1 Tax=Paenibacillus athensensis TaxID=1967502 RepID=A0A4Y8Q0P2_9BACL|nr:hypothetical protein [Paenibacillus athensensis]MCD1261364.1 hypothetical protein [Paenibacillus athensensis]